MTDDSAEINRLSMGINNWSKNFYAITQIIFSIQKIIGHVLYKYVQRTPSPIYWRFIKFPGK